MVIPAVRVIIGNDHSSVAPLRCLLQTVNGIHHERLLRQWIRISRVAILEPRSFQENDFGEIAGVKRVKKIGRVILVLGAVALADVGYRARTYMVLVRALCEILERLVVRDVITFRKPVGTGMGCSADCLAIHNRGRLETSLKKAPSDSLRVQQLTYV